MLSKLIQFELLYYIKKGVFWLAISYAIFAGSLLLTNVYEMVYNLNSPFSIVQSMLQFCAMGTIFITGFIAASSILRDSENNFEAIIYSTPVDKFQFLTVKFIGLFSTVFFVHVILVITMLISTTTISPEMLGVFRMSDYIYGLCVILLPNVLLCTSIIFSTAMLTKKMIPIYIVTLLIFVLYLVASMIGNSPMMAMSSPFTQEGGGISSILDPYAIIPFFEQSSFWSVEMKNTMLPELKGSFLYNRLIWLTVSLSIFAVTYNRFSFQIKHKTPNVDSESEIELNTQIKYSAVISQKNSESFKFKVFLSKLGIEYISVVKGIPFLIVLSLILTLNLVSIGEQIMRGPLDRTSYYPLTELILEILQDPLSKIGLFVSIFYAVELYWNERSHKMDMIIDSTPVRNSLFFLSKLSTLAMICFTIILASIISAIMFQFSLGHFDVKPLIYLRLFYYSGSLLILVGGLTLILQKFAPNKPIGLFLGAAIVFYPQLFGFFKIAHPLTIFAFSPHFIFSDMANVVFHEDAYDWLNLYWASVVALLSLLGIKYWKRGTNKTPEKMSSYTKYISMVFLLIFILSGSYNYYQYNIMNVRKTKEERIAYRAYYEKTYSTFKDLNQPTITHINVDVDVYPDERRYKATGNFTFQNKTEQPIQKLMVSVQKVNTLIYSVNVPNATLESKNEIDQVLWYKLNKPLNPNETAQLDFSIDVTRTAFSRLDGENYVTSGGSYFELEDYLPFLGYLETYELNQKKSRIAQGLTETSFPEPEEADPVFADNWIHFNSTISTPENQVAVTVGNLENDVVKNGRRYVHYKTDQKIGLVFPITSAEFTITEQTYKDVTMKIFHAPHHNKDNAKLFEALTEGLDYFNANFVPFTFKEFKIIELPYFSSAQSFGAAFPGMYGGVENRFFNLNHENAIRNESLRGVIHEFSHQYWGMYITPQSVGGYPMLTEVLAKYSELVLQERLYGKYSNNKQLAQSVNMYLKNRTRVENVEKPLYKIGFNPMIYYAKGLHSMTALRNLIGEENINKALRSLLAKYRHPNYPTSLNLLDEYYSVSDSSQHPIINDLFKRLVFHDFKLSSVKSVQEENRYSTSLSLTALKYVLSEETNKEFTQTINDSIEVAFYSGFPDVENKNMTFLKKVKLTKDITTLSFTSDKKPKFIKVDPNMYRIDRSTEDNIIEVK